jgi:tetratricopeptide (TPR) repeat protein
VVAVDLDPSSDLYWTNLGWAWYLLGFVDRSEAASLRALELDPAQYIARYNLGLVRVVTRRPEALADYREALRFDPDVDARPSPTWWRPSRSTRDAIGVPFALGFLLENAGDREAAARPTSATRERAPRPPDAPDAGPRRPRREAASPCCALRCRPSRSRCAAADAGRRGPAVDDGAPGRSR